MPIPKKAVVQLETCDIYHSIPLDELNTHMQEFLAGGENSPSYRHVKIEKPQGGVSSFCDEKFDNTNDNLFERARQVESNETKINAIGQV